MSDFQYLAFDVEANGFVPSEIFCISMTDLLSGEKAVYDNTQIAEACMTLIDARMLVGHYIRGYDCPVIERLTGGLVTFDKSKMVDTLDMSKKLTKNQKHSLKFWGNVFGIPKLESPLFEHYTPEIIPYCNRDVEITVRLFHHLTELYLTGDREAKFRNCEHLEVFFDALVTA